MKLLVDIGNTRTKYIDSRNICLNPSSIVVNTLLDSDWFSKNWQAVSHLIISNVNEISLTEKIRTWATLNDISCNFIQSEKSQFGVTSYYTEPSQLGVDRWLALLGAASIHPKKNILIVDTGSATTVDILANGKQHLGGWILPGIDMMYESLLSNTARIKSNKIEQPSLVFGASSSENVNNGCWAATVGLIEMAIIESERQLEKLDLILLTGGNAEKLSGLISRETQVVDNLIFHGLDRYN